LIAQYQPIKIVFVITALNAGGAEGVLHRLIEIMDSEKFSPYVISLTSEGEVGLKLRQIGIPLITLGMTNWQSLPMGFLKLVGQFNKIKPDIVHTWLYHADLVGGLAAKMVGGSKVIWGIRSADFLNPKTGWLSKIIFYLCVVLSRWIPDLVIYNSWKGYHFHRKIGYKIAKSVVIPNGVDLSRFKPNRQYRDEIRCDLGLEDDTPLIGLIGRYDPLKNQIGFIAAAKKLYEAMPGVHYLMVGKDLDPQNEELKAHLKGFIIAKNFHLLGSQTDIHKILPALDLMALTSFSEGCPNVLMEAMASEIPCVSTDAGDAQFIIGGPNWIVSVGDMNGMAKKWELFFNLTVDEKKSISVQSRHRINNNFEIQKMVKLYETEYVNILPTSKV